MNYLKFQNGFRKKILIWNRDKCHLISSVESTLLFCLAWYWNKAMVRRKVKLVNSRWLKGHQLLACLTLLFQQIVKLQKTVTKKETNMVANEKPKWKNAGLELTKLVSKEKESDSNTESASSKDDS